MSRAAAGYGCRNDVYFRESTDGVTAVRARPHEPVRPATHDTVHQGGMDRPPPTGGRSETYTSNLPPRRTSLAPSSRSRQRSKTPSRQRSPTAETLSRLCHPAVRARASAATVHDPAMGHGCGHRRRECLGDLVSAFEGLDAPCEGHHVPPIRALCREALMRRAVRKPVGELSKPLRDTCVR